MSEVWRNTILRNIKGDGKITAFYPNATVPELILSAESHIVLSYNHYKLKRWGDSRVILDFDILDSGELVDWNRKINVLTR